MSQRSLSTQTMASKSMFTKSSGNGQTKEPKSSSHLSTLMMLSSQLLSHGRFNEGLPTFITRGLDSEQIWQQLELRNEHKFSISACTRDIVRMQSKRSKFKSKKRAQKVQKQTESDKEIAEDSGHSSVSDDEDENVLQAIKKRLADQPSEHSGFESFSDGDISDENEVDFDFEMDRELSKRLSDDEEIDQPPSKVAKKLSVKKTAKQKSVVDDKFFKLADMEEFLDSEDKKEERRKKKEERKETTEYDSEDDSEEDDVEIDMFNKEDDENDDVMEAMYGDFFDPPDNESLQTETETESKDKSVEEDSGSSNEEDGEGSDMEDEDDAEAEGDMDAHSGGDNDDPDSDNSSDDSMNDEEIESDNKISKPKKAVSFEKDLFGSAEDEEEESKSHDNKSSFEKKQEQLQSQAREMEEQSLREAPWELTGEATASKRPENSLLETVLDFQHTTRAAPVITDETTKSLEDYIKQRIKDKAFDDVERKEKPKEDPFEFKKRIVLDQEKSKLSLGELYEQEFLKQQQQDKEEVKADPECEKIEADLGKLFQQLDALCNFRYTPMKAGTEVKIVVNTPAITMEEVAPVATTDAQLLAPEEVKEKVRHDLKAVEERDSTDKKRDRRQKKKEKREKKKAKDAREKVVEKMNPGLGNKYSKAKAIKKLEQISKFDKSVSLIKDDNKKLSSSSAFFNQLQEEVQTNVRAKKALKAKKKKPVVNASKLML
ncbi:U3 small nucleolar ribonucleoprotein protein MPP10 [Elysia marginata]|uniref:U3 small nucleolar ribonucleoprotein protein MPP10 n=1 Tax=Elysia marginata TaxID=1093978 RepID=A0AAV4ILF3_9GAST|nr:U3 small nucleolar ribonucleoprotein protein MPP10 [Elysia marginata]